MNIFGLSDAWFPKHHGIILKWQRRSVPLRAVLPCLVAVFAAMVIVWAGCLLTTSDRTLDELLWRLRECMTFLMRFAPVFYALALVWCVVVRRFYRLGRGRYLLVADMALSVGAGYGFWTVLQALFKRSLHYQQAFSMVGILCCLAVCAGVFYTGLIAVVLEREQQKADKGSRQNKHC